MTDVSVQYFSHLNGITLANTWGDLISTLDICLVNGITLPYITDCLVDENGNLSLTFDAPHKALLFQIVEFKNFNPASLNGKYRIINVVDTTKLILKATNAIQPITIGQSKLSSLGYEIIFTGTNKRVYRALSPTSEHPYIRVDESLTSPDGTTGVYTSTYAKSAIVGLLSSMTHIDDYNNPDVLQLPMKPENPGYNWKIIDTGTEVIRGWSRWYYSTADTYAIKESLGSKEGNKPFTIIGDKDAFYFHKDYSLSSQCVINGCGLVDNALDKPNPWFLASHFRDNVDANTPSYAGAFHFPFVLRQDSGYFKVPNVTVPNGLSANAAVFQLNGVTSGNGEYMFLNNVPAFDLPFTGLDNYIRGSLKHIKYAGKKVNQSTFVTPVIDGTSMYIWLSSFYWAQNAGNYYYLGEL